MGVPVPAAAMPGTRHAEWTKLRTVPGTLAAMPRRLAVLAVWAAGALLAGGFLLRLRDA